MGKFHIAFEKQSTNLFLKKNPVWINLFLEKKFRFGSACFFDICPWRACQSVNKPSFQSNQKEVVKGFNLKAYRIVFRSGKKMPKKHTWN
jgi:hypothetical protein